MSKRFTVPVAVLRMAENWAAKDVPIIEHIADALLTAKHHVDPAHWYPNEPPDKTVRKIFLSGGHAWHERPAAIKHIKRKDAYIATGGLLHMHDVSGVPHDDTIYRISVFPSGVEVICFGLESVDSQLEGHYDGTDLLPDWVKERLAVLNMIDPNPPTNTVEGVGRRISAHVYWVFAPDASTSA